MAKGTKKKKEPRVIPGTSDYVVRENAARKQLGAAGLAARNKQVPAAARAALREMTGIDVSRKGVSVDPGNVALAAAGFIPFGKSLSVAAKLLKPAGMRIAGAASRTVSRATSRLSAAEKAISSAKEMENAGTALRNSVRYSTPGQNTTRLGLDFANPVGNKPNQAYNYVIKDVARKGIPEGTKSAYEIGTAGRLMQESGRTAAYNASKAAQRAGRTVEGGKYAASEEIKRRLKALQGGGR